MMWQHSWLHRLCHKYKHGDVSQYRGVSWMLYQDLCVRVLNFSRTLNISTRNSRNTKIQHTTWEDHLEKANERMAACPHRYTSVEAQPRGMWETSVPCSVLWPYSLKSVFKSLLLGIRQMQNTLRINILVKEIITKGIMEKRTITKNHLTGLDEFTALCYCYSIL